MVQRHNEIENTAKIPTLDDVQNLIANDVFLRPAVLDLQVYNDTLVVFTDRDLPRIFVKNIVAKSWHGPIEIHCATDLMMGA